MGKNVCLCGFAVSSASCTSFVFVVIFDECRSKSLGAEEDRNERVCREDDSRHASDVIPVKSPSSLPDSTTTPNVSWLLFSWFLFFLEEEASNDEGAIMACASKAARSASNIRLRCAPAGDETREAAAIEREKEYGYVTWSTEPGGGSSLGLLRQESRQGRHVPAHMKLFFRVSG